MILGFLAGAWVQAEAEAAAARKALRVMGYFY